MTIHSTGMTFDEVAINYKPMIKKQIQSLRIYKNHDDFYQIGLIGLWEAYTRFNPEKGKFSTFAMMYVRGKMMTMLQQEKKYSSKHTLLDEDFVKQIEDQHSVIPLQLEMIKPYLEGLTRGQQLWLIESNFMQKTTREIAQDHGVPVGRAKSWRRGVQRKLRESAAV